MFSSSLITTVGLSVRCVGGLRGWAAWVGGPHNGISTVISCRYQVPGIVPVERWVGGGPYVPGTHHKQVQAGWEGGTTCTTCCTSKYGTTTCYNLFSVGTRA